ncbi:MAG: response regulator [Saprospiraceae bacterium]|nr:response regulator [Saprospiraceae bacterium]
MKKKLDCIMLIDDDFATNLFHKLVIEESGFAVNIVVKNSAEEALDYLKKPFNEISPKPNLIFLDINMPRMSGWDFLEHYKELPLEKKAENIIVMLSTSCNPDDLARAERNPCVKDYRSKPLTVLMLEEILDKFFELPQAASA